MSTPVRIVNGILGSIMGSIRSIQKYQLLPNQQQFRSKYKWDPVLIMAQIVAVQSTVYVLTMAMDYLLQLPLITQEQYHDSIILFCIQYLVVVPLALIGVLYVLVQRARLCVDFGITFYIFHLAWIYYTGYLNAPEWFFYVVSCTESVLIAEWLCMRREMEDIPVNNNNQPATAPLNDVVIQMQSVSTQRPVSQKKQDLPDILK